MKYFLAYILICTSAISTFAQDLSAKEIIAKAEEKFTGTKSMKMESTITTIRPKWTREMGVKSWSLGDDYSMILITSPARDKGIVYLKRNKEIWNWMPSIERTVKLPPSMMSQSWMGTDFSNDDLVRQNSKEDDYDHKLLGKEMVSGRNCYKIEMIPHKDAAITYGKIIVWIDTKDFLQLKTEFYDEDMELVSTMIGSNIQEMGGKIVASKMEMIPADEDGHKTVMQYKSLEYDIEIEETFFSTANMKNVR